jgi:cytidyltransferase-like protein
VIVLCLGSFDILHYGHIEFLQRCAVLGDVVVGLGTDAYQEDYKHRPFLNYQERSSAVAALGYTVVERDEVSVSGLLDEVEPDYLVWGSDWIGEPILELSGLTVRDLTDRGITLVFVPRDHDMSSSEIVRRVNAEA